MLQSANKNKTPPFRITGQAFFELPTLNMLAPKLMNNLFGSA